jgi:hypothetical protein
VQMGYLVYLENLDTLGTLGTLSTFGALGVSVCWVLWALWILLVFWFLFAHEVTCVFYVLGGLAIGYFGYFRYAGRLGFQCTFDILSSLGTWRTLGILGTLRLF